MAHHPQHAEIATIHIAETVWHELIDHMKAAPSKEVCGILLGKQTAGTIRIHAYQRLSNTAPDPVHHFQLDPHEWIKCCYTEPDLIGLFHSHPHTAPIPSQKDLQQLPNFAGMIAVYMIGSLSASNADPKKNHQPANAERSLRDQNKHHHQYNHPYEHQYKHKQLPDNVPTNPFNPIHAYNIIRQTEQTTSDSRKSTTLPYALTPTTLIVDDECMHEPME